MRNPVDNKKRQRNLNLTLIGLATASIGMFTYSNVYLPNFAPDKTVNVYVAARDIPAHVKLEKEMFKTIKVDEDSYISGSITNLSQIEGKQLSGKLEQGELLSQERIAVDEQSDGPLIAELSIPTTIPLQNNDTIRVYVQYVENGKVSVEELFHAKKVIARNQVGGSDISIGEKVEKAATEAVSASGEGSVVYVRVTDQEAMDYQEAINTGTLYAVKVADVEDEETLSSGSQTSEHQVKEKQEDKNKGTVALYEVKEGDTLTSIAKDFMTSEDRIVALNDGKTDFKAGDKIQVPGN